MHINCFPNFTIKMMANALHDEVWSIFTSQSCKSGNTAIPTYLPPISKLAATGRLKASANNNNALNSLKQKVMDVSTPML